MDCHNVLYFVLVCYLCIQFSSGEVEQSLRLRGGRTALEGQVEIYLQGSWGVIHDEDWTMEDASVACRQMGFAAAVDALQTGYSGPWPPSSRVVLESVQCAGREGSLLACKFSNVSRLLGDAETIASVVCAVEGSVQLVGGCCAGEGVLQTLVDGAWLPVCADGWGRIESRVACRQLGYEQGAMFQAIPYGNVTFAPRSYSCNGSEYNTQFCIQLPTSSDQCNGMKAVSLQCTNMNSLRQLCSPSTSPAPTCQPGAPQTVTVAGSSCSSLTLTWFYSRGTRQTATLYRYTIRHRRLGNASWEYTGASTAGQAAGTGRFTIGGLDAAAWYEVQISARNEIGSSSYSGSIIAQTQPPVLSSAPQNVSLNSVEYSSAQISWNVVQTCNGSVGYEVVLYLANLTSDHHHMYRFVPAQVTGDQVLYVIRGLMPTIQYKASVRAFVNAGPLKILQMSPLSEPIVFTTSPIPAPVNVKIQPLVPLPGYPSQIQVNWTVLSDVAGYNLRCSNDGTSPPLVYDTLKPLVVAPGNTNSHLLPAAPNTLYNCSLYAICGSGDCSLKTNVLVQTPEMVPAQPPSDVFVSEVAADSAVLHWTYTLSSSARLLGFTVCTSCFPVSNSRPNQTLDCVPSYQAALGSEGGKFSRTLTGLGSGEECTTLVAPVTTAGDGPNGTVVFITRRKAPTVIPTNLKATLLSTAPSSQTFNFTWDLTMESTRDNYLGFILRCHDTSSASTMLVSGVTFMHLAQDASLNQSLTVAMVASCNVLICQVVPFNELGEGVASNEVILPLSCPEDQSNVSILANPNVSLALLANAIVLAIILLALVPVTCVCVLSRKGRSKQVHVKSIETGVPPTEDNYTTMAPSPLWREHSIRSQKLTTLSVGAMEITGNSYDTIDKASVQNFYDEIRPKVQVPNASEQLAQPSQAPLVGAKVLVSRSSPKMSRHNRGSTEYVEMFSIITPDTPESASPSKQNGVLLPLSLHERNMEQISDGKDLCSSPHPLRSHDVAASNPYDTAVGSHDNEVGSCDNEVGSCDTAVRSCDAAEQLDCSAFEEGNTAAE